MMKWILMVFEGWHTADTSKVHRQRAEIREREYPLYAPRSKADWQSNKYWCWFIY